MAITNYSELKSALANYLARSDLTSVIPDFITQAESRLNRAIRTWDMEVSSSVTMSSGTGTLPSDYLEWISATWTSTDARKQDLRYMEANSEEWRLRFRPNGDPTMFTILASNIKLKPVQSWRPDFLLLWQDCQPDLDQHNKLAADQGTGPIRQLQPGGSLYLPQGRGPQGQVPGASRHAGPAAGGGGRHQQGLPAPKQGGRDHRYSSRT